VVDDNDHGLRRSSPRRTLSVQVLDGPTQKSSPLRTSPRRTASVQVHLDDQRKRLVRTGQSVRKILAPESDQDLRAALAKTGQSVRGLSVLDEPTRIDDDTDDSDSEVADSKSPQEATTSASNVDAPSSMSASFSILEDQVMMKETRTPKEAKAAAALPRMGMSMSNIPYMEPLVEEDSDRNESEEFYLPSITATSRNQPLLSPIPADNADDEDEVVPRSIGVRTRSARSIEGSVALEKIQRSPKPAASTGPSIEPGKVVHTAAMTSKRQTKMGLISRVSTRFLRKGMKVQSSRRMGTGLRSSLSCRHVGVQVVTDCYGPPPGLTQSTTTSTFTTVEAPSKSTELSHPASPVRQVALRPVPHSALTPPPRTSRPLPTVSSSPPRPLSSGALSPKTSRPVPIIRNVSYDPKDVDFLPPIHARSFQEISFGSLRKSSVASDSVSGSPTVSPIKSSLVRSPSRTSPRRNMSRSQIRSSIRSIISQRSFATNHAVSEGIYPQKAGALAHGTSPCRRSLVARLSFRLSQSDLNHDEGPRAIRNGPDPSNLQEKQEERRNLLSRMARQRDADARTVELSITHTREETFVDADGGNDDDDADEDASAHEEDDYGYVPPMISFYATGDSNTDGEDNESAITDACTWAEMSVASMGSRCAAAGDIKVLPSEIQNTDDDNVSCLVDGSGSFRLAKPPTSRHHFGNSISGKSMLDSSFVLLDGDDAAEAIVLPGVDKCDGDEEPSVSLFHVSPTSRDSFPKMMALRAKTLTNLEHSDGSLYHDDDPDPDGKPKAKDVVAGDEEDEVFDAIPGDTMDENFYLAEIVKALEEQNRKTRQAHRKAQRAKKSKPSDQYLMEF
jgi:hypothetical protein